MATNVSVPDRNFKKCISGKYVIQKPICKGSCGKVYLAENIEEKKNVVIKIITKLSNKFETKIKRDSEIPNLIVHKNIVKILDFGEYETFAYIVYPYFEKSVCLSKIKLSDLNFDKAEVFNYMITMLCQICDAIRYMHSKFIVHRDIKPDNIIITEHFAFLIDFDLAFIINDSAYPFQNGLIGTPYYLAPEMWRNELDINYILTDIYAFGITLYYVFNKKKLPYKVASIEDLEHVIRYENPILSNSSFPLLDKLIMSIIDKNPINRPSITEIKLSLKKLIILNQP